MDSLADQSFTGGKGTGRKRTTKAYFEEVYAVFKHGENIRKRYGVILAVIGYIVFFVYMEGWGADWESLGKNDEYRILNIF